MAKIYPKETGPDGKALPNCNRWRVILFHKGKRREFVVTGTKKDAESYRARKMVELEQEGGFRETRTAPTLSTFCVEKYTPYAQMHLKGRTLANRVYVLATLMDFFGNEKLTEITTARGIDYQQKRLERGREPSTVNDELKVLKAILNYARSLKVPTTEFKPKKLPERKKKRLKFWSAEQVQALLRAIAEYSPSIYWLVLFLLETGCRKGEAIALRVDDVDFEHNLIRIWPNEEWQPKSNEPREVPLDEGPLLAWLRDQATSKRDFVFVTRKKGEKDPGPYAYFPQNQFDRARNAVGYDKHCLDCKRVTVESPEWVAYQHKKVKLDARGDRTIKLQTPIPIACVAHGLVGGPHTTRHTYATHFLAKVPDLYLLAEVLGHSQARVTSLYAHLLPEHLDRARGAVSFVSPVSASEIDVRVRGRLDEEERAIRPKTDVAHCVHCKRKRFAKFLELGDDDQWVCSDREDCETVVLARERGLCLECNGPRKKNEGAKGLCNTCYTRARRQKRAVDQAARALPEKLPEGLSRECPDAPRKMWTTVPMERPEDPEELN